MDVSSLPGMARVSADGTVMRLDDIGVDLSGRPMLIRAAIALLRAGRDALTFLEVERDERWTHVSMTVARETDDVVVSAVEVPPPYGLTPRELDVLTLLAGGLTNTDVAHYLGTSPRTVSKQVESVLAKLGQATRSGAAAFAVDHGLLRLPLPGRCPELAALAVGAVDKLMHTAGPLPAFATFGVVPRRPVAVAPHEVGLLLPLLGASGDDGEQMRRGAELAVEELNARGGVAGRLVRTYVTAVDALDAESVSAGLAELAAREVSAIVGGYLLTDERASYEIVADYGAPYLNIATSDLQAAWVRQEPDRFGRIFQTGPTRGNYGKGFARFLHELRPRRRSVGFVETTMPDTQAFNEETSRLIEQAGLTIDFVVRLTPPYDDWNEALRAIRTHTPGAVMITHHLAEEAAAFQREFVREPSPTLVYMVYTPAVPQFLRLAGQAAEGVVWATVTGLYGDSRGRAFVDRFTRKYGAAPGRAVASAAYDQINLLALAWASCGRPQDFDAVARDLRALVYRGVNGVYDLDRGGQTSVAFPDEIADPSLGQAHLIFQVQGGAHRIISPTPYAEATFRQPPWIGPSTGLGGTGIG
ncbi:ABC transporter substrate-binding protein [Microbispora siamensis]|uniref:ABC transporter substrate-binding protein n=1 Tax=Microbispora siamensis TaxID=564413 RepID=UPI001950755F|nr:ABC transporter substrate-binding protein [Microbispora siamensis]